MKGVRKGQLSIPLSGEITAEGHWITADRSEPESAQSLAFDELVERLSRPVSLDWLSGLNDGAVGDH